MILALAIALGLMATGPEGESLAGYAEPGTYRLEFVDGAPFAAEATIRFEGSRLIGQGPCNTFSAQIAAPYPWFAIGPIRATRMACPDLAAEQVLLDSLREMELAETVGSVILLTGQGKSSMEFRRETAP